MNMRKPDPTELAVRNFKTQLAIVLIAGAAIVLMVATRSEGWVFGVLLGAVIAFLGFLVLRATWRLLR